MSTLLEAHDLTRVLTETVPVTLVSDVTLNIERGEFVAITGASGSGKSSLLYLLGLLDRPTRGVLTMDGRDMGPLGEEERAALRLTTLGFVFQFHFLLSEFTALENVIVPMRKLGVRSRGAMRERAMELLAALGLADHLHKLPSRLSGGQRQRVAVARALANDPPIVMADEPTGSLDSASSEQVFLILEKLVREHGKTVIAVTHDQELAMRMDRTIHLVDGCVVSDQRNANEARVR